MRLPLRKMKEPLLNGVTLEVVAGKPRLYLSLGAPGNYDEVCRLLKTEGITSLQPPRLRKMQMIRLDTSADIARAERVLKPWLTPAASQLLQQQVDGLPFPDDQTLAEIRAGKKSARSGVPVLNTSLAAAAAADMGRSGSPRADTPRADTPRAADAGRAEAGVLGGSYELNEALRVRKEEACSAARLGNLLLLEVLLGPGITEKDMADCAKAQLQMTSGVDFEFVKRLEKEILLLLVDLCDGFKTLSVEERTTEKLSEEYALAIQDVLEVCVIQNIKNRAVSAGGLDGKSKSEEEYEEYLRRLYSRNIEFAFPNLPSKDRWTDTDLEKWKSDLSTKHDLAQAALSIATSGRQGEVSEAFVKTEGVITGKNKQHKDRVQALVRKRTDIPACFLRATKSCGSTEGARSDEELKAFFMNEKLYVPINTTDEKNNTLVECASAAGQAHIVRMLVQRGCPAPRSAVEAMGISGGAVLDRKGDISRHPTIVLIRERLEEEKKIFERDKTISEKPIIGSFYRKMIVPLEQRANRIRIAEDGLKRACEAGDEMIAASAIMGMFAKGTVLQLAMGLDPLCSLAAELVQSKPQQSHDAVVSALRIAVNASADRAAQADAAKNEAEQRCAALTEENTDLKKKNERLGEINTRLQSDKDRLMDTCAQQKQTITQQAEEIRDLQVVVAEQAGEIALTKEKLDHQGATLALLASQVAMLTQDYKARQANPAASEPSERPPRALTLSGGSSRLSRHPSTLHGGSGSSVAVGSASVPLVSPRNGSGSTSGSKSGRNSRSGSRIGSSGAVLEFAAAAASAPCNLFAGGSTPPSGHSSPLDAGSLAASPAGSAVASPVKSQ